VTLKHGLVSPKVIEDDTIQSGTHDFLLTFHGNHRPISHCFRDKRRFPSKIANFSHPRVFNAPAEGVSAQESKETRMIVLPNGRKSFKIGLSVLTQYWRVTDPASHVAVYRAMLRVARVVSEMTYTVSSGTLNSSIPYHTDKISPNFLIKN